VFAPRLCEDWISLLLCLCEPGAVMLLHDSKFQMIRNTPTLPTITVFLLAKDAEMLEDNQSRSKIMPF
jgi:hypothetical protein